MAQGKCHIPGKAVLVRHSSEGEGYVSSILAPGALKINVFKDNLYLKKRYGILLLLIQSAMIK